jgi:iron(III) transport system substrate-binding protein
MKLHRVVLAILAVAICCGWLVGCSTPDSTSKELTVYTALEPEQVDAYLKVFEKAHPDIKVTIVRDSTGIITAKLLAEKANPQADLVWGTAASSLLVCKSQGMLEPYTPKGLDRIQPTFRDKANPPSWVGIDVWETAIVVNTVEAAKLNLPKVTSYQDLLKPEFKGHIIMPNPASSGTGFLTVSAILQMKSEAEGWAYLDALHANISQYVHSGSKPAKMAGARLVEWQPHRGQCDFGLRVFRHQRERLDRYPSG